MRSFILTLHLLSNLLNLFLLSKALNKGKALRKWSLSLKRMTSILPWRMRETFLFEAR
jgi:hypothetical protein